MARELLTSPITIATGVVLVVNRTNTHTHVGERINEFVEKEKKKKKGKR